jgi:hypothetical protein
MSISMSISIYCFETNLKLEKYVSLQFFFILSIDPVLFQFPKHFKLFISIVCNTNNKVENHVRSCVYQIRQGRGNIGANYPLFGMFE